MKEAQQEYSCHGAGYSLTLSKCYPQFIGRGHRLGSPIITIVATAGEDAASLMELTLQEAGTSADGYMIWGHSVGGHIAYETYQALRRRVHGFASESEVQLPRHMILSGRTSPRYTETTTRYHLNKDDEEFIDQVDKYGGGTAEAFHASAELREIFLPVLRADFELSETYVWDPSNQPISCPTTLLNGADDLSVSGEGVEEWMGLITGPVNNISRPGGHFPLYEDPELVREVVTAAICRGQRDQ